VSLKKEIINNIINLLKAKFPIIWLNTLEEKRVIDILAEVKVIAEKKAYIWDEVQYWKHINDWTIDSTTESEEELPELLTTTKNIDKSFQDIDDYDSEEFGEALFIYPDFHLEFQRGIYLTIIRRLKWLAPKLRYKSCSMIIISNSYEIPTELENIIHFVEIRTPDLEEMRGELDKILSTNKLTISEEIRNQVSRAALGLTLNQANHLFSKVIAAKSKTPEEWVDEVTEGKKSIISSSVALEFFAPNECPTDLGGLENLKNWLEIRRLAYTLEAEKYFLPKPKGVGLVGIPGTGKSFTAKYIAGTWHLPLLRFDVGALYQSLVGQSEANLRRALQLAETIAPCILWIDEIEKLFPKDLGGDAGTSRRLLGYFLTWMQEKEKSVFIVATANDINAVPPELFRKGRFDEIFALDLPNTTERNEIFKIHIKRVHRNSTKYDIQKFVKKTDKYTGAEIEQIVKEALYNAFSDIDNANPNFHREPTDEDFIIAINKTKPLFKTRTDDIEKLKKKIDSNEYVNASLPDLKEKERKEKIGRPKIITDN